jgi:hypothetical protein
VACLLQSLTEARERRDVTPRPRGHDQNAHRILRPTAAVR